MTDHQAKGQMIGYVRVSSTDQNTARQLDGLTLDRVFIDKLSGKNTDRPQLKEMISYVRFGDTVIVHSLDRLARNFDDLLAIIKELNAKGVTFKSQAENITIGGIGSNSTSPMDTLILHIFGAIAQFNRALIKETQRQGIEKAKERGVYTGRKPSIDKEKAKQIDEFLEQKNKDLSSYKALSYQDIADKTGISLSTLNRYMRAKKQAN